MKNQIRPNNKKYKVASLFCGCGGLDLGLQGGFSFLSKNYENHPFEIIWANDKDKNACLTYGKNLKHPPFCEDIEVIFNNPIFRQLIPPQVDIVMGGFPCQDFSLAGKRRGLNSKRGLLYKSMVNFVKLTKPIIFIAENVKGIMTIHDGKVPEQIKTDFERIGFDVSYSLYHVANFGIPQSRERVFFIGTKKEIFKGNFIPPKPLLEESNWITLDESIGDLENLKEGAMPNHYWSKAKMFKGTQGNTVVGKNKVGPTMRAEHHGNIEWHWNERRRLSAREAARIQSFPDDFVFYPSTSSAYKQIGNAVPPVMGWHLGKAIKEFLHKEVIHEYFN
jgi:DNA (cytosine-5)-methyltransferase 1